MGDGAFGLGALVYRKKNRLFLLKRGTVYRVYGSEIAQEPRFELFLQNPSAGSVANVPLFRKKLKKSATLSQGRKK